MNFSGKHVLVLGAKRSGLGAAQLLQRQGATVRAMDLEAPSPQEQAQFDAISVPVVLQKPENTADDAGRQPDVLVASPGVPYDLPLLVEARARGAMTMGEVELAAYFLKGPVIGITGSNGKTTTTALTGHLLKESGIACQIGGNIGTAVTALISTDTEAQWNVLELSSFQLESISKFRASIGACLNVTPDHLDRHHTFENYAAAKGRLFETQEAEDCAVLNYDDAVCRSYRTKGSTFWFSSSQRTSQGVWLQGDEILFGEERLMARSEIKLRGLHNVENVMAAMLAAHLAGARLSGLAAAVKTFPGVPHRIEFVRELEGVAYYNDSKATNVDATLKAINAFPSGLWVILGGKDKGSDYRPLGEPLRERGKAALLIGAAPYAYAAAPLIKESLAGSVPLVECGTLENAVSYARKHAKPGDTVLLAPACASFDQFRNFEERGEMFKQLVKELF